MTERRQTRRQVLGIAGVAAAGAAAAAWRRSDARADAKPAAPPGADEAAKKPRLTLGFPTYMFKNYDLDQTIAMTNRLAVRFLCLRSFHLPLEWSPEQIAAAVAKVRQAGLTPYAGGTITIRSAEQLESALAYAKAAGFGLIVASPHPSLLDLLDRKVKEYDIRVAIHNHGPEDKLYPTPIEAYEKIRRLDRRIGLCHDTGHTQRTGMDAAEATRKVADRLMDMHLKDVDAAVAKARCVELGRGVVNVPGIFEALRQTGYKGIVGIEYEKDLKDLLPGLAESVGYARGVLAVLERKG